MSARTLASLLLALLALGLVAGCGSDESADSSTDVDQLLDDTFSGGKQIDSGRLSLALDLESDGGQGPVTAKISGPFQSEGEGRLPQVDLEGSFEGGGESLSGGVTVTADAAYVSFGGETYEVAGPVFEQLKAGYEQSAKEASGEQDQSLASLGIDPRRWLTNARNEGESMVGDTETIKITGDVDVPKLLDDVNAALEKIRALGVQGSDQIPEELTEAEKQKTAEAIEQLSVEIHTGAEDRILRRIVVALGLAPAGGLHHDRRRAVGRHPVRLPAARRQRGAGHRGAREREAVRGAAEAVRGPRSRSARRPRRSGRRQAAGRRRVLRVRAGEPRRQRRRPQVRRPPEDPVAAYAA